MAKKNRSNELLSKAADEFLKGNSPFCDEWLAGNNVTLEECMCLSERIGSLLKGYLAVPPEIKKRIIMAHAIQGTGIPFEMIDHQMKVDETLGKLKKTTE